MLGFLDLILSIAELLVSWRLYVTWLATSCLVALALTEIPNNVTAYSVAIPIGVAGFFGGFYWQIKADSRQ